MSWQTPPMSLLVKLGSIARHVEEAHSSGGHPDDLAAAQSLVEDSEVKEWMAQLDEVALLPVMRHGS